MRGDPGRGWRQAGPVLVNNRSFNRLSACGPSNPPATVRVSMRLSCVSRQIMTHTKIVPRGHGCLCSASQTILYSNHFSCTPPCLKFNYSGDLIIARCTRIHFPDWMIHRAAIPQRNKDDCVPGNRVDRAAREMPRMRDSSPSTALRVRMTIPVAPWQFRRRPKT